MKISPSSLLSEERPFPGLRPFDYADHPFFFGRTSQVHALYRLCDRSRFVAVVGSSGCGKSSLVRAGLRPFLDRESREAGGRTWSWVELRPGGAPLGRLTDALTALAPAELDGGRSERSALRARIAYDLHESSFGIGEALSRIDELGGASILLVVDQFEELFRYAVVSEDASDELRSRDEAAQFVQLLLEATRAPDRDVRVLLTMRSDFIGDCARFHGLPEAVSATQFLVPSLTRDQIEEVIRKPIEKAGGSIEPELVERLLNDCSGETDQLPVLQHCLARLWERAGLNRSAGDTGRHLTSEHYRAVGRIGGALSQHADEILRGLEGADLAVEQVFRALSELDKEGRATRRALPFSQLLAETGVPELDLRRVVDRFRADDCSFLVPSLSQAPSLAPETRIDVGHEALLRRWARVSRDVEATLADDPNAAGWLRAEERDGHTYRSLLTFIEAARRRKPELNRQQFRENWAWWRARPRTEAWAKRYGGAYERVAQLFADSRVALRRQRMLGVGAVGLALLLVGVVTFQRFEQIQADREQTRLKQAALRMQADLDQQARVAGQRLADLLEIQRQFAEQILESMEEGTILVSGAQELLKKVEDVTRRKSSAGPRAAAILEVDFKRAASDVSARSGESTEALRLAREGYKTAKEFLAYDQNDARWQSLVHAMAYRIADILVEQWVLEEATDLYNEARDMALRLAEQAPESPDRQADVASIEGRLGGVLLKSRRHPQALERYQAAFRIVAQATERWPNDPGLKRHLGAARIHLGQAYARLGEHARAAVEFEASLAIGRGLFDTEPRNHVMRANLMESHLAAGSFYDRSDPDRALMHYREARELIAALSTKDSVNVLWQDRLAQVETLIGDLMSKGKRYADAEEHYRKALDLRLALAGKDPSYVVRQRHLGSIHVKLGEALAARNQFVPALEQFEKNLKIREQQVRAEPANRWRRRALSIAHERIGRALGDLGSINDSPLDHQRALEHYQIALQISSDLLTEPPPNDEWKRRPEELRRTIADLSLKMRARSEAADAKRAKGGTEN
jgi:tetratricopeptide (TPR) repeat protein